MRFLKFNNAMEMFNYIKDGNDLYSKSLGIYIFVYNDADALCKYDLCPEDAAKVAMDSEKYGKYWASFLGWKGSAILDDSDYDDDEHRYSSDWELNKLYLKPSLEFCEETYMVDDWLDTNDVTVEYIIK